MRGHFLLNDSLRRLGLREVRELPKPPSARSMDDIVRLAFFLIDPKLFPEPSWLLPVEAIDLKDADHAIRLADLCRDKVEAFDHVELKLAYFQGVLGWGVVRRAKQGASCQVKDLMFQNLASRNYRVLQLC